VDTRHWVDFLVADPKIRSNTSICLRVTDPAIPKAAQAAFAKALTDLLEGEKVAFDIGSYRGAPPGIRIWCGATVETSDIEALTPWLDYAFAKTKGDFAKAA
jgi:phosphoserine aminotransferase